MDKFKRNSRVYRLITTATKNNATTDNKYLQDTTPAEVSIQTQNEYIQLHDEITKEPDSTLLSPEDPILEENRQKVLLDISSSVHFTNITTDTHENISTCTEVNDAFQNLIHMDDYESGSRFIDSAILNTEHELPDVTQQEPEQSSFHQENANLLSPTVNQSDNADTVFNPTTDMPVETGKGFCYVWVEGIAGRVAQEVDSSLRKHISLNLYSKVKELILWSDSCGGQNRNIKVTLLLFAVMEENENLEKITLWFMVPGHSFLENDSEFSDIESCLKTQTRLYTPQDYINVMTSCRKKNKLTAFNMEKDDFVGVSKMMKKIVNRKKDLEGNSVSWLKTKEISIFKNKPGRIFLSTTHGGHPQEVNLNKRPIRGQNCTSLSFFSLYEQLWPEGKPIAQPKLDDIKSLLHLIPSDARCWYEKLTESRDVDEDINVSRSS